MFVAKLDPDGNWLWAQSAVGPDHEAVDGITFDGSENVYVTGYAAGDITFDGTTLLNAGDRDLFVARLDPDGICLWAIADGGTDYVTANRVGLDSAGDIYMNGVFRSTATFGTESLTSAGDNDAFILKYLR